MNLAFPRTASAVQTDFLQSCNWTLRQEASILKFHQALVPGDNCLLWHDLCNTFHPLILESKECYQRVLVQMNRRDSYPDHICEEHKTHLGSSRTRSYWLSFENEEMKATEPAPLLDLPLWWRHGFLSECERLTKMQPESNYIVNILSDMCKWYVTRLTILPIYRTLCFHRRTLQGQAFMFPFTVCASAMWQGLFLPSDSSANV